MKSIVHNPFLNCMGILIDKLSHFENHIKCQEYRPFYIHVLKLSLSIPGRTGLIKDGVLGGGGVINTAQYN